MLIFAVLLAFLLLSSRPSSANLPIGWWLPLLCVAGSIVLNFTRGVWFGSFVATLYLVGRRRARWLWALPILAAAGYVLAPALVRQRLRAVVHPSGDPALEIRIEMWRVGLNMIRHHPLRGVGPNNVNEVYTLYLPPGEQPIAGYHEHLHNDYLQLAAERGIPCLVAWLWIMAAFGWHFLRIRAQNLARSRLSLWAADGALAALLAFVTEGFFEYNAGASPVLMLLLFIVSTPFLAEKLEQN